MTAKTHRHGWRSGMALIASGRVALMSVPGLTIESRYRQALRSGREISVGRHAGGAHRVVVVDADPRRGDRAILHRRGLERRRVVAVGDEVADRVLKRLVQTECFHDRDTVG